MRYLITIALVFWSSTCLGQFARGIAESNSWIVVLGAVEECPHFAYRILDAQSLKDRDSLQLVGISMNDLVGLTSEEILSELQSHNELPGEVLGESLKILVYKVALPPPVIKRIIVQESRTVAGDCEEIRQVPECSPSEQYRARPRSTPYRGDGPDDINIEAVEYAT